jgi:hypothetical protein
MLIQVSVHVALFVGKYVLLFSLCLFTCWLKSFLVFVAGGEGTKAVDLVTQGDHGQILGRAFCDEFLLSRAASKLPQS